MLKYIIIPTYNEAENLQKLAETIFALPISDLNIIIIDDNSPDGTGRIADKLKEQYNIEVLHRAKKEGIGSAYAAGFKKALGQNADLIFEMDADFSHNPYDIPRFIAEIERGYDVIIGSRRVPGGSIVGWSKRRNLQSRGAMIFARWMLGLKTKDITAGFRCFRAETLRKIGLDTIASNGYAFQEELIFCCEKAGFKIKEIPVIFVDRQKGKSKLGIVDIVEFFITIMRLRLKFWKLFLTVS